MTFQVFTKSIFAFAFGFCLILNAARAQSGVIRGKVVDGKTKEPLEYAAITISTNDSLKVVGAISNQAGEFTLSKIPVGSYQLKISYLGYKSVTRPVSITATSSFVELGSLFIEPDGVTLNEVTVKAEKIPVTIRKDTVEFNADSYKTRPNANTEELLKKLPGVEVDRDGNITIQGQRVSRLTVDGKDFFGTDPKTATKNLPADAIEKVQVVDSKTQEAKATGIDDGQREKVLNLTIKKDRKKGWFGNANVSGGTTDKYNGYLSANRFQQDKQFAVLAMSNNMNTANFSWDDLRSFAGGDVGSIFAPPGGGRFSINVNNNRVSIAGSGVFDNAGQGLVTTHSGGLNFSDRWGKKKNFSLSGSYFTYFSQGDGDRFSNIQNVNANDILRTTENSLTRTDNQAHRINMRMEYKPDTLTDIVFRPNVIINLTDTRNSRTFFSAYDAGGQSNDGIQNFSQDNFTPAIFGELSVLRRLGYKKGSVSVRLNGSYNNLRSDWVNLSSIREFDGGGQSLQNINQSAEQENTVKGYTLNGNYSRPLTDKWSSNLAYTYNKNSNVAGQYTLDFNPVTGRYEILVPTLTNVFDSESQSHSGSVGFVYNVKALNVNFGSALQHSILGGLSFNSSGAIAGNIDKEYMNLLPRFSLSYRPKNNRSVNLNYRSMLNLPPVSQMQPVQDNTNPLYQREGNPDLEPLKTHRVTVNYNTFNAANDRYWNGFFMYNYSVDAITNDTRFANGVQIVKPVNVDGNYFVSTGTNFGMPAKVPGLRLNFGVFMSFDHIKNFINSVGNLTQRLQFSPNMGLNYDFNEKFNLSLSGSPGYNLVQNSRQIATDNKYWNFNSSLAMSWEFIKDLRVEADLNHTGYAGRSDGFNSNYFLLNAGLEKFVMKRQIGIALKGFDILKQNTNIDRIINNGRIEDVRFNNITRYFYLSLTYRLAKVGAASPRENPRTTVN